MGHLALPLELVAALAHRVQPAARSDKHLIQVDAEHPALEGDPAGILAVGHLGQQPDCLVVASHAVGLGVDLSQPVRDLRQPAQVVPRVRVAIDSQGML